MAQFLGWLVALVLVVAGFCGLVAARLAIWAGLFWFAAWLFPGVEAWAMQYGAHFWYGGIVVALLTFIAIK